MTKRPPEDLAPGAGISGSGIPETADAASAIHDSVSSPDGERSGAAAGPRLDRRQMLGGAAAVAGTLALAACGSGGSSGSGSSAADAEASAQASSLDSASGSTLVGTAEVPVGSAVLATAGQDPVLVSQPESGSFKAFSAICTHQGCPLTSVEGSTAICTCHGSKFNVETGAVEQGPATQPLAEIAVGVQGTNVVTK